jgi:hypothetical protein
MRVCCWLVRDTSTLRVPLRRNRPARVKSYSTQSLADSSGSVDVSEPRVWYGSGTLPPMRQSHDRHPRHRTYRCFTLARYNASKCNFTRLNADTIDTAALNALASFYRTQHTLIRDAITTAQAQHQAAHTDRHAELTAVEADLTKTGQTIDRYLAAFERGTIDEDLVADRLTQLHTKTTQLRARRDELTLTLDDEPTTPEPATLTQIANHITEIITSGTHNQTEALVEALIAKVTITAPDRLIPIFRIPQPNHHNQPTTTNPPGQTALETTVRTMTKSVELLTAYSHTAQAADLQLCHTMTLTSLGVPRDRARSVHGACASASMSATSSS